MTSEVYVSLGVENSKILVEMFSEYIKYLDYKGELHVRLLRALYGTVEAAKLFNDHVTGMLAKIGFKPNPCNPCVLNMTYRGDQVTVTLHVDDLKISCVNRSGVSISRKSTRFKQKIRIIIQNIMGVLRRQGSRRKLIIDSNG
jgi:hypothetical protein